MFESTVDQETMQYTCDFYRHQLPNVIEMMADCILRPQLLPETIDEAQSVLELNSSEQKQHPATSTVLTDLVLQSCFSEQQGLGRSMLTMPKDATRDDLIRYMRLFFRPERCVIAGAGVDHEELVQLVKQHFVFPQQGPVLPHTTDRLAQERKPLFWTPADKRIYYIEPPLEVMKQNMPALTAAVISFPGASYFDSNIYTMHVLETALGGGDSFSAGGPGKGLLSIINQHFLSRYEFWNMMAQHYSYHDTGVFCVHASAKHENANYLIDAILKLVRIIITYVICNCSMPTCRVTCKTTI